MMETFKFGRQYIKGFVVIDVELFERNIEMSRRMFLQLTERRERQREEADARQRESIERLQRQIADDQERAYHIRIRELQEKMEMERERERQIWAQQELMNQHKKNALLNFWGNG